MVTSDRSKWQKIQKHSWLLFAICVIGVSSLLPFSRIDTAIYDHYLSQNKVDNQQVVIIAIDDKSISALGRWPWPRDIHAELLLTLVEHKPSVVGIDLLFSESSLTANTDEKLASAIAALGNVVLPVAPALNRFQDNHEQLPIAAFAAAAKQLGHNDLEVDPDGVVRVVYRNAGWQEARWPSFSFVLAHLAAPDRVSLPTGQGKGQYWTRDDPYSIMFSSKPVDSYAFVDVLYGRVDPQVFANKVVLLGVTATGLGERFAIPTFNHYQRISGVEVNAGIVQALLQPRQLSVIPSQYANSVLALLLLATAFALVKSTSKYAYLYISLIAVSIGLSSILLFNLFTVWFAPSWGIFLCAALMLALTMRKAQMVRKEIQGLNQALLEDEVTNLPNKRWMDNQTTKDILLCESQFTRLYFIVINIGRFKSVNDLLGFNAGNHVLNLMARRIERMLIKHSKVARQPGPEFAISVSQTNEDKLKHWCKALHQSLSEPFSIRDEQFRLPISIGVSCYPEDGLTAQDLLSRATVAMHRAVEWRDNGVCFYHKDINMQLEERRNMERDLAAAVEKGQIDVHYQPQVCGETGEIIGIEALARWRHPKKGFIPPDVFIPIAETTGDILGIGDWILQKACADTVAIQRETGKQLRVGVNLSAAQFVLNDIIERVTSALKNSGLAPEFLELELTESCLVQDIQSAENTLVQLKDMGVKLSIDDFGTGYSSLSYLKHFSMDRIKIDRSFISEIGQDNDVQEITTAIISMARSLNMSVIAEGVENQQQIAFLQELACEELQGFYFSKPITHNKLITLIKNEVKHAQG